MAGVVGGGAGLLAVRRELPALQTTLHTATVASRQDARLAGQERLAAELGTPLATVAEGWAADDVGALAASQSLAAAWGGTALGILGQADTTEAMARALVQLPELLDGRVRRTAATEVADAFNDERDQALSDFAREFFGAPDGPHEPNKPAPGMFKVWSAILDGRTCERCFAADGDVVEMHASLRAGVPPLHAHCRCVVEHVIINKTERIEDMGIDYGLFKQELRDVIREGRIISDRHAVGFVSDSLGPKRSPEVLARRFRDEKYATNAQPTTGFRLKPAPPPRR